VNRSSRIAVHHRCDWRLRAHHIDRPVGSHRPGPPMQARGASHTAVPVCQGRAAAQGRAAPGRFSHATATALLRDDGNLQRHTAPAQPCAAPPQ
jgi:hypothetical protein